MAKRQPHKTHSRAHDQINMQHDKEHTMNACTIFVYCPRYLHGILHQLLAIDERCLFKLSHYLYCIVDISEPNDVVTFCFFQYYLLPFIGSDLPSDGHLKAAAYCNCIKG